MTVTEFALLRLRRNGHGDIDLLEALCQCLEIQDQWIDDNKPHLREKSESLSNVFLQQDNDEPYLLITAAWDSRASHQEWIKSEENREALSCLLGPYLAEDTIQLFHMTPAGSNRHLLLDDVLPHTSFKVTRLEVDHSVKTSVEKEYQLFEDDLNKVSSTRQVWAGWKIESDAEGREILLMFWDPSTHLNKIDGFLRKFESKETRCFRSVYSESICRL